MEAGALLAASLARFKPGPLLLPRPLGRGTSTKCVKCVLRRFDPPVSLYFPSWRVMPRRHQRRQPPRLPPRLPPCLPRQRPGPPSPCPCLRRQRGGRCGATRGARR